MKAAGVDRLENFPTEQIAATFQQMLDDWTNEGFDPFAAPQETGSPYGRKHGNNTAKITRARELATRCVGLKGDLNLRTDERGAPVNRAFADVPQDQPELHPEPGFENEVHAFNLFAFLSRSQVTWNPSFTSVVKYSFMCRRRKSTSCPSSTPTTGWNGSSRCATRSTGTAPTRPPASRWPG